MSKKYISSSVIILGLIMGGTWGFVMTRGQAIMAENQKTFVPGPKTSERIEQLKAELEKTAQYELAYGCVQEDGFKNKVFCGASKQKIDKLHDDLQKEIRKVSMRSQENVEKVKKNIKALRADEALVVEFESSFSSPYSKKQDKRLESYKDAKGFEYWVNPATNQVVQFGPGGNSNTKFAMSPKLSEKQLRDQAEKFLVKNIPDFERVKKEFIFESGSKGDGGESVHAFRWNAPSVHESEQLVAFVQVVLSSGGDIMSFNDTRSLYEN